VVKFLPSKQAMRVRFPLPAPFHLSNFRKVLRDFS